MERLWLAPRGERHFRLGDSVLGHGGVRVETRPHTANPSQGARGASPQGRLVSSQTSLHVRIPILSAVRSSTVLEASGDAWRESRWNRRDPFPAACVGDFGRLPGILFCSCGCCGVEIDLPETLGDLTGRVPRDPAHLLDDLGDGIRPDAGDHHIGVSRVACDGAVCAEKIPVGTGAGGRPARALTRQSNLRAV